MNKNIKEWKHLSDDVIYQQYITSKFIPRLNEKYKDTILNKDIVVDCLRIICEKRNKYNLSDMEAIFRWCHYINEKQEILECLFNYLKIENYGNCLSNFITLYGNEYGSTKYQEYISSVSLRNKNKNYQTVEHIAKKHNISLDEAKERKLNSRKQSHKTRLERYGKDHYKNSSCLTYNYYINKGYDISEIEKLREYALSKVSLSKSTYIKRYNEDGIEKHNNMLNKRKNTLIKRIENNLVIYKNGRGKASKESVKFFDTLISLLTEKVDLGVIHYGTENYRTEWRMYNKETNNYYFLDFYLPKYKIAIEYDNIKYHCIDPNNWPEKHIHLKENNLYYYEYENNRKKFIKDNVNLLLVIRSDNIDILQTYNTVLKFIEEYNGKI